MCLDMVPEEWSLAGPRIAGRKKKEKGEIGHQFADARPCVLFKRGERRMWSLMGGDPSQYVTWSSRTQDQSVFSNAV